MTRVMKRGGVDNANRHNSAALNEDVIRRLADATAGAADLIAGASSSKGKAIISAPAAISAKPTSPCWAR